MVENKEIELTDQETELYDRQIRLWGLDSQKRLRSARVLLCGLSGFGAEIAKNIILSGIKSIKLLDHRNLCETDLCSQFLAPQSASGTNRAEASLQRAQALNPMVVVTADTDALEDKPDEYFGDFDVVIITEASSKTLVRCDNTCRLKGVKFFAGDVWGMFGYSFADLQEHQYAVDIVKHKVISQPNEKFKTEKVVSTTKRTSLFPPLQDVLAFDIHAPTFVKKLKRTGYAFVLLKVLQQFRDTHKRDPAPAQRAVDIARLHQIRDEIATGLLPDNAFEHVFAQVAPAAAIVGGELAQEVIKAVSQRETPHHNVFLFDPETCCGFVESIGN